MRKFLLAGAVLALGVMPVAARAEVYWFGTTDRTNTMSECHYDDRFETIKGMETFLNSQGRSISWEQDGPWGVDGLFTDSGSVIYLTTNPFACKNTVAELENRGMLVQEHWQP